MTQSKHDLGELEAIMERQTSESDEELRNLREQLSAVIRHRTELKKELSDDLQAAKQRRTAELTQLQLELEQANKKLAGLMQTLVVTTPVSGKVAYRNPSPGTVHFGDPLVVIGPSAAFRFRTRLPAAQANALKRQESVPLELRRTFRTTSDDVELPPQQLVRRFIGRPLHFQALEDDPAVMLVELSCQPPADAVRELALGETVRAELVWSPPFYTLPLFVLGAIPFTLGIAGLFVIRQQQRTEPRTKQLSFEPPTANASLRHSAPDAAALRLLGEQLAEMVKDQELDPSLLATVEWALDRHGLQGAQHLAQGIRESGPISNELNRLVDQAAHNGAAYDCGLFRRGELVERLTSLLKVVAPAEVSQPDPSRVKRLAI
jgi:hypothetical protein